MDPTRILVVEDEESVLNLMGHALSESGYAVAVACSGETGLELFRPGEYQVVVSDVNMPGIDGIEMIRAMKERDASFVPIVVTGVQDQRTAIRAMECGIRRFLAKPFTSDALLDRVEDAIREQKQVTESRMSWNQMEEQLLYAERLSVLGQLAPRIAHEIKTPLQLIQGYVELAMEAQKRKREDQVVECLGRVSPVIRQLADLVTQMTNLGKPTQGRREELDLRRELDRTLDVLRPLGAIKHCRVEKRYEDPLPTVPGDPAQVEQVFRNLLVNGAHAMESVVHRVLTLELRSLAGGERVEAAVGDTGTGIPEENLERIFHPFFTTKPEGKGTGLGLPIVKTIVERHGGDIRVESREGAGARFVVTLPTSP
jgi:signal transduction histidine kinase